METLPCLDVTVVKDEDCVYEWKDILLPNNAAEGPTGSLAEFEARELRRRREPSPERDDWTPDDWADEQKEKGDAAFKDGKHRDAVVYYTRALRYTPTNEKLLANRSAAYMKINKFQLALDDALQAEGIQPQWSKVYFRKGQALRSLKRFDNAILAFEDGKDVDADESPEWDREIKRTRDTQAAYELRKAVKRA